MRQFLIGNNQAFHDLEQRAGISCVVFADQEMPPGTSPARLRIGFEIVPQDGAAVLLVDEGADYSGESGEIREWLSQGKKRFANFSELRDWLNCVVKPAFYQNSLAALSNKSVVSVENLTDLSQVSETSRDSEQASRISSERLFDNLSGQIRGQGTAIRRLSKKVSQHLARRFPRRPATIFALGSTGVGKTQTAEYLPTALRQLGANHQDFHYLRLDMSEYQEKHRVSQLLGSPQGYIGYNDGSQLIDALMTHPQSIVLFDEIEKAHPDILRTLMNAMDAGRLSSAAATTNRGREIDCRRAIFFFTSNIEVAEILAELEDRKAFENVLLTDEICRKHLKRAGVAAELIGRIGCFLVYRPLSDKIRIEIMALAIIRGASEYGLVVSQIAPETLTSLLKRSKRQEFGARPDEYLVDEVLGETLAQAVEQYGSEPISLIGTDDYQCVPVNNVE